MHRSPPSRPLTTRPRALEASAPGHIAERRNHPRVKCIIPGRISVRSGKTEWKGQGTVINVGEGGLCFRIAQGAGTPATVHPGDNVTIHMSFSGQVPAENILQGSVVHTSVNAESSFGIKFRNLEPRISKFIQEFTKP